MSSFLMTNFYFLDMLNLEQRRVKKMKKLFIIGLSLFLLMGCSSEVKKDPYELYSTAFTRIQNDKKMDVDMISLMEISLGEESIEMNMDMNMKMDQSDKNNPVLAMTMTMDFFGESAEMSAYYKDNKYYMDTMGEKVCVEIPFDEALSQVDSMTGEIQEYEKQYFENATVQEENGNTIITFNLDDEQINQLVQESLASQSLEGVDKDSISYNNFESVITLDGEGNLLKQDIAFDMKANIEGEEVVISFSSQLHYLASGEEVVIELPDFSEYSEIVS